MAAELYTLKVGRLADAASNSARWPSTIRWSPTAIRRCARNPDSAPGCVAPMHWHSYVELLFIIEGEARLQGGEADPVRLKAGDCVALPADIPQLQHGRRQPCGCSASMPMPNALTYVDGRKVVGGYPVVEQAATPWFRPTARATPPSRRLAENIGRRLGSCTA